MTAYHKWLVKQRRYCEHRGCLDKLSPAVSVVNVNGKDLVMCDWHARIKPPKNDQPPYNDFNP
jgi:hypothetical protein